MPSSFVVSDWKELLTTLMDTSSLVFGVHGAYDIENDAWFSHVIYPLDAATSQAGGWVGLYDL